MLLQAVALGLTLASCPGACGIPELQAETAAESWFQASLGESTDDSQIHLVPALGGGERPRLVGADPLRLLGFAAPEKVGKAGPRFDIEIETADLEAEEIAQPEDRGPIEGGEASSPAGALSAAVTATVELLEAAELADWPAIAGFRLLAGLRVDLAGRELTRPATLRLPSPSATGPEVPGDPRLILAEWMSPPKKLPPVSRRGAPQVTSKGPTAARSIMCQEMA